MPKRTDKNYVDTDINGFFSHKDEPIKTDFAPKAPGFFGIVGKLFSFVSVAVVIGLLLTLMPTAAISGGVMGTAEAVDIWRELPDELDDISIAERNVMYDANGDIFAQVWAEDRVALESLDEISDYAEKGLIATEDKRFYEHTGIDYIGTARSAVSGSGGGSGLTQQLVKNLQFYNMAGKEDKESAIETSYARKLRELKLAYNYEENHTKDEILLEYFNTVAFGAPNIYSIESASQYFFGKSAKDLTLAESAVLVGSVQNPVIYDLNDDDQKDLWKNRQLAVLDRMFAEGYITREQAQEAADEELTLIRKKTSYGNCASSKYPFYCQYVLDHLSKSPRLAETQEERDAILARGGLQIKTYLEPRVVDEINEELKNSFGNDYRIIAPTAVVEPGTGGVSGFGVNREYGEGEGKTTLNLPNTPVGVGSTYKPIVLAAAFDSGMTESDLTYSTPCPFRPDGYDYPGQGFKNSLGCNSFQTGELDYKEATAWSSNTWYTDLGTRVGLPKVKEFSKELGLNVPDSITDRSLSLVLGPVENSPVQMAAAYAAFANQGIYCPPTPVASYEYADGTIPAIPDTYDPASEACKRVMSPNTASLTLQSLRANTYEGEVKNPFGRTGQVSGYDAVGKSGTNERFGYSWGQVSANYSMFMSIYDMDRPTNEVYGVTRWRGATQSTNPAPQAGAAVLQRVLQGTPKDKLDYNNKDKNKETVPVEKRDFFTIPSVIGMKPAEAVQVMESVGITTHVSKETRDTPNESYPEGVIVEQSLEPGTQLAVGTSKEVILYITE